MAYPQPLQKKAPVARAVTMIAIPEPPMETRGVGGGGQASEPSYT